MFKKEINKVNEEDYVNYKKLDKYGCIFNVIFGQRGNGKTYGVCKKVMDGYKKGVRMAYIRRFDEELVPSKIKNLFSPFNIAEITKGEYTGYKYYSREFFFTNEENKTVSEKCFCKTFSLNTWERSKGADNGFFDIILFDEFMTRTIYLQNEFMQLMELISSIVRDRDGTKIYLLANSVNTYCPYFEEFGFGNLSKMNKGDIRIYKYGENDETTLLLYYTKEKGKTNRAKKYFAFDNPKINMITEGDWQIKNYPHMTYSLTKDKIIKRFYIDFYEKIIAGDIFIKDNKPFIFFHKQTKYIDLNDEFCFVPDLDLNSKHFCNINSTYKFCKIVKLILLENNVFYENNQIGEDIRNWKNSQNSLTLRDVV